MSKRVPSHIKSVHNRRGRSWLITALVVIVLILLAIYSYDIVSDVYGFPANGDDITIVIPQGANLNQVADILEESGVIKHNAIFRMTTKDTGKVIQQGEHVLNADLSYDMIMDTISSMPQKPAVDDNIVKVTIPEGFEIRHIADTLESKGLINRDAFMEEIKNGVFDYPFITEITRTDNRLEGYLFPATYEIHKDDDEHEIIDKMLKKFNSVIQPYLEKIPAGKTLDDMVIMASIIEREAGNDEERTDISAVFWNRIKKSMSLQSCATVQYVLKERKAVLSIEDTLIESKYNTYKYKGLPTGPIASPGEPSIKAAFEPSEETYLYFAAKADGTGNLFSKTLAEHNRISQQQQSGQTTTTQPQNTQRPTNTNRATPKPTQKPSPTPEPSPTQETVPTPTTTAPPATTTAPPTVTPTQPPQTTPQVETHNLD